MVRPLAFFVFLSAFIPVGAIAENSVWTQTPALSGYVTRISSPSDFDVNGLHVIHTSNTVTFQGATDSHSRITGGEAFFGERVDLYGKIDRKKHEIEATKIVFCKWKPEVFSGLAVIDRILPSSTPKDLIVRADGYRILINSSTRVDYVDPLSSLTEIKPNTWITYHGTQGPDGTITADKVTFQSNDISNREGHLLKKKGI